jgi:hypothetical protein
VKKVRVCIFPFPQQSMEAKITLIFYEPTLKLPITAIEEAHLSLRSARAGKITGHIY